MELAIVLGCVAAGLLFGGWLHRRGRRHPGTPVVALPVAAGIPEAAGAPKAVGAPVKRAARGLGNTGASRFGPAHDNIRAIGKRPARR
jgi:hypothetical protein